MAPALCICRALEKGEDFGYSELVESLVVADKGSRVMGQSRYGGSSLHGPISCWRVSIRTWWDQEKEVAY